MRSRKRILSIALMTSVLGISASVATAQSSLLVQKADMAYQGSFKVPTISGNGLTYGGHGLAYNPAKNSLYIVGHIYDLDTAEISIPAIGGTATLLQSLKDSTGGKLNSIGSGSVRIGGNLVYKNKLYTTGFVFYDANNSQTLSHFNRPLDLSASGAVGPYRVGSQGAGFYSGYMTAVPSEWQAKLGGPALTGNCCMSIISRTSYGPSVASWDPENSSPNASTLVSYDQSHQTLGTYGASGTHPVFNGTTRVTGVFFPPGTASVLFFGTTGVGNYCYGEAAECGDPSNNSKGEHAYPYRAYIWAYNANDLAAVKAGSKAAYSVTPYATWELSEFGNIGFDYSTGGAAFDPATGRVYVSEINGDGEKPLIHVYKVAGSTPVKSPNPPSNVSVQ
jgi:hypothetical protein